MFVLIGLLGGFTTFSTFALETFNLMRDGEFGIALLNILITNFLGILLVFLGFNVSRMFLNVIR
jgi:CrcB protein